jgi:leucyl/phenylalanyl-tRNA--protein transferase
MPVFPDPRSSRGNVVAVGDDLRVETLVEAYRRGIFPWPTDEGPLPWFSPRRRAVLPFDEIHVGRSLRRSMRQAQLRFTIDHDFESVIHACAAAPRPGQDGTWIFPPIVEAYTRLYRRGYAHSVEAWDGETLVGGVYGVDSGGLFTGESMFHTRSDASKLALLFLCDHLRARGSEFLDCQVMTPHVKALGARLIPRGEFLDRLEVAQGRGLVLF